MTASRIRWLGAAALAAALFAGTPGVLGQSASSSLAGEVRTEAGLPVPDAVVQARSEGTGAVRTTVSDDGGRYRLEGLNPGRWTVVARLPDGELSDSRSVALHIQQTMRLDFTAGSGIAERVVVRAETPLIDRKETAGKLIVTGERAADLPLAGRVFTDLALLDSSVGQAAPGNYFGERGAVFTVNGQSGRSNSFLVDGLDNNDSTSGTSLNSFFSQLVIEEFVLLTHQFAPEFGRASGGLLNIVTRRGTNEHQWSAFVQGTADGWNDPGALVRSVDRPGIARDSARRLQGGYTFGGPLRRDRAFYFLAFEHQEADDIVPYTGIDRRGLRGGWMVAPSTSDNVFLRTDFNLGPRNSLMLRLSGDDRSSDGVNVGGVFTPEAGFRIEERDLQLAATWTAVISGDLLGETRLLLGSSKFDQFASSDRMGITRPSGIFGGNTLQRQRRDEDKLQLVQNVTWRRGAHTLKFGLDLTRSRTRIAARFNANGSLLYDYDVPFQVACGDLDVSDLATHDEQGNVACPGGGTINVYSYPVVFALVRGEPAATLDDTQVAVFAQDRVEVGSRWLLDYGLRYDLSTFELPANARVDSAVPNGGSSRDGDNVSPRFGFTFTPRPGRSLLIRGGAGIFYDKLVLAFPAVSAITSGTDILLLFPRGTADERVRPSYIDRYGLAAILRDAEELREFLDPLLLRFSTGTELETPHTVQWNLGLEHAVGRRGSFRADLIQSRGYDLPLMRDLNPVSGLVSFPSPPPCTASQIDPGLEIGLPCHLADPLQVGSIAAVVTDGRSWYTGLDLGFRWQAERSWLQLSYTWSDAEDLGFDPLKGGISLPPNSDDIALERGRADGHRDHRLAVSGELGLPWLGLRASTLVQLASGMPFNVTTGQDDNLDGFANDRPPGVGRNTGEDTPLAAINAVRDQSVVPLEPIRSLDEPSLFQVDLRVFRPFAFDERRGSGQLFLQVFNLFDRANWGLIEGRAISPDFGRPITLAGPPRTLELGLRLSY